jgi:hypothetical protein
MRTIFTLFAGAAILFCSCSSSHKVHNTDDPGYSSGSPSRSTSSSGQDDYYSTAPSDNYVRMKTVDQSRWSTFDDYNSYDSYYAASPYSAGYSPYGYGYGMYGYPAMSIGLGFWDPYFGWNNYFMWNTCYNPYFYNPYYGGSVLIVKSGNGGYVGQQAASSVYNRMNALNASTYHTNSFSSANASNRYYRPRNSPFSSSPVYNSGNGRRFSNNSNSFFSRSNSYNPGNSNSRPAGAGGSFNTGNQLPARSYSPPPSGGGGGFGGSGGGGGNANFNRGNSGAFRH